MVALVALENSMPKISYEEIGLSEVTGESTIKHEWSYDELSMSLKHIVDGAVEYEYSGNEAYSVFYGLIHDKPNGKKSNTSKVINR